MEDNDKSCAKPMFGKPMFGKPMFSKFMFSKPTCGKSIFSNTVLTRVTAVLLCISFVSGCAVAPLHGFPATPVPVVVSQTDAALSSAEKNQLLPYRGRGHGRWGRRGRHPYPPGFGFIHGLVAATVVMALLFHNKDRSDY